ncbi:MAG: aminotransferase class IV [bacterium]
MVPTVYWNGQLRVATEVGLSVADQGFLLGQGAFETLRAYDGRIFRLRAHLSRLFSTLGWLGVAIPESPDGLATACRDVLAANALRDARIRITVSAGPQADWVPEPSRQPSRLIQAGPLEAPAAEAYRQGIATMTYALARGPGPITGRKSTSFLGYVLARRAAREAGAYEALLVGPDQELVEGALSNLFLVREGRVLTPPLSTGPLAGITRQVVLELLPSLGIDGGEASLHLADLPGASEAFVTSSVVEVLPVISVDGRLVGAGRPGPTTLRILEAYGVLTRS